LFGIISSNTDPNLPLEVIRSLFKKYDKDGSNVISQAELGNLLYDLGIYVSGSDLPNVYLLINTDGKGGIELGDFCSWWRTKSKFARLSEEQLERVSQCSGYFSYFDSDRSGSISSSELPNLYQDLSRNRLMPPGVTLDDFFKALDKDKNGIVTLNEFIDWMGAASYH